MLGALLLNIPQLSQHGAGRGYTSKHRAASTTWNPRWSEIYGPDAQRLKDDKGAVERAVSVLREAEHVPEAVVPAKEIVHSRSLVDELDAYQPDTDETLVYVLEAYLVYIEWRRRDDETAIALALLL